MDVKVVFFTLKCTNCVNICISYQSKGCNKVSIITPEDENRHIWWHIDVYAMKIARASWSWAKLGRCRSKFCIVIGSKGRALLFQFQILSFLCSFRQKKFQGNRLTHPLWELAPPREYPGSATAILLILLAIGESRDRSGARDAHPLGEISFNFMQFSANIFVPLPSQPVWEILDPPLFTIVDLGQLSKSMWRTRMQLVKCSNHPYINILRFHSVCPFYFILANLYRWQGPSPWPIGKYCGENNPEW